MLNRFTARFPREVTRFMYGASSRFFSTDKFEPGKNSDTKVEEQSVTDVLTHLKNETPSVYADLRKAVNDPAAQIPPMSSLYLKQLKILGDINEDNQFKPAIEVIETVKTDHWLEELKKQCRFFKADTKRLLEEEQNRPRPEESVVQRKQ